MQAILVRPAPDGTDRTYELVAGARRFRASKLAGKETIPATVRDLTDAECREIQLVENLQRADIHELDEGIGYRSSRIGTRVLTELSKKRKNGKTPKRQARKAC